MLHLLVATGLQIPEFALPSAQRKGGWLLNVMRTRVRCRTVLLPADLVRELGAYLAARSLPQDLEQAPQGTYLVGKVDDLHVKVPSAERADPPASQ